MNLIFDIFTGRLQLQIWQWPPSGPVVPPTALLDETGAALLDESGGYLLDEV